MTASGVRPQDSSTAGRGGFWGGIALALVLFSVTKFFRLPTPQCLTAATAGICAVWWVAQPVPIPVTSILPFALLPLFGVIDHKQAAQAFGHPMVMLLMAGFMLSTAVEACGAHKRLALGMARLVGGKGDISPRRLLMGFMLAAAFASMWISNTATTLILLPIIMASTEGDENRDFRQSLFLGVAYAASIGGIATPIGTPPNLLFMAEYEKLGREAWSFTKWMTIGVPVVLLMLPLAYAKLSWGMPRGVVGPLMRLAPASQREKRVLIIFGLTALAWMTRMEPFGGWSALVGNELAGDATVAFAGLAALLLIPDGAGSRLLSWEEAERIPWGILLLFGGGIALASGFQASGLSASMGSAFSVLQGAPEVVLIFSICIFVTFLTEVTSNTATTALLMPILASAAASAGVAPEKLMVPAAISASCAFMLPVATAPNAIIFGSGHVPAPFMARQGFFLNLVGAVVVTTICVALL